MNDTNIPVASEKKPWGDTLGRTSIRSIQLLSIVALVGLSVFALTKITLVVIPILLALILTAAISPVVRWMVSKGVKPVLAAITSFVALLVIAGGVMGGIILAVINEWGDLLNHAKEGFDQLYNYAKEGPLPIDETMITNAQKTATDFFTSSTFGSGALSGISAATTFFTGLILMIVILFFFLKDGSQMWQFFLSFLSGKRKEKAELAGTKTMEVLGGYIRGTAAVAGVDAVVIGAALAFMGIPLALPLSVLIFIGGFIPLVGATAAGAFAVLVALVSNGPGAALAVLIVVIIVNQLEGNFLQPVLMGNALNVHGLVILLALTVGTVLAGIIGAVLSVPLAAVLWAVIKVWRGENEGEPDDTGEITEIDDVHFTDLTEEHIPILIDESVVANTEDNDGYVAADPTVENSDFDESEILEEVAHRIATQESRPLSELAEELKAENDE